MTKSPTPISNPLSLVKLYKIVVHGSKSKVWHESRLTAASSNLRAPTQDSRRPSAVTPHEKLLIAASNGVGIGAPMPFQKGMILSCSLQPASSGLCDRHILSTYQVMLYRLRVVKHRSVSNVIFSAPIIYRHGTSF